MTETKREDLRFELNIRRNSDRKQIPLPTVGTEKGQEAALYESREAIEDAISSAIKALGIKDGVNEEEYSYCVNEYDVAQKKYTYFGTAYGYLHADKVRLLGYPGGLMQMIQNMHLVFCSDYVNPEVPAPEIEKHLRKDRKAAVSRITRFWCHSFNGNHHEGLYKYAIYFKDGTKTICDLKRNINAVIDSYIEAKETIDSFTAGSNNVHGE